MSDNKVSKSIGELITTKSNWTACACALQMSSRYRANFAIKMAKINIPTNSMLDQMTKITISNTQKLGLLKLRTVTQIDVYHRNEQFWLLRSH